MTNARPSTARGFVAAAALGGVHAAFSLYWAVGGTALAWSLGTAMVESFHGSRWLLAPIGLVKLAAALAPMALARHGWPVRRLSRSVCWLGAVVLVTWGGLNTVVGNLVLAGVIRPDGGYDRAGMVGHAWLWDPLFLCWGIAVALGLLTTRGGGPADGGRPGATAGAPRGWHSRSWGARRTVTGSSSGRRP